MALIGVDRSLSTIHSFIVGAQSDSEVSTSVPPTEASDRGYTSDSELYESPAAHRDSKSSIDIDVKPLPGQDSWLMVCTLKNKLRLNQ